jgi:hypothetical protein
MKKKKQNTTTINKLTKKKQWEKIERTTPELIWIIKQLDANPTEEKLEQKESN